MVSPDLQKKFEVVFYRNHMPENLIEGLQAEIIRVKEIVVEYEHPSLKGTGVHSSVFHEA